MKQEPLLAVCSTPVDSFNPVPTFNPAPTFSPTGSVFGSPTTPAFGTPAPPTWVTPAVNAFGAPVPKAYATWSMRNLMTVANSLPIAPLSSSQTSSSTPFSSLFSTQSGAPGGVAVNQPTTNPATTSSGPASNEASAPASNEDTAGEDTDGQDYSNDPQVNLVGNAGEENEDVAFVTRARALKYKQPSGWETQGVGPLRVLKNREAGRARLVLRADPSGKVVLNTAIQKAIDYKVANNSIQFIVPRADGSGVDPWALRVKTKEDAAELGKALAEVQESLQG